jgi:hypothetical protein
VARENLRTIKYFKELGVDGRITLKSIFKK